MCCQPHLRKTFCGEFMDLFVLNVVSLLNKGKQLTVPPLYTLYLDFKKLHRKGGGHFLPFYFRTLSIIMDESMPIILNIIPTDSKSGKGYIWLFCIVLPCIHILISVTAIIIFFLFIFGALRFLFEFL